MSHQKQVSALAQISDVDRSFSSNTVTVKCYFQFRNKEDTDAFIRLVTTPESRETLFPRMWRPCHVIFKRLRKDEDLGEL